jgi:cysteine-rich repeat protein
LHNFACDDGNPFDTDGCTFNCLTETGFQCLGGTEDRADVCEELCDDDSDWHNFECEFGPGVDGDGCNVHCEIEVGWFC